MTKQDNSNLMNHEMELDFSFLSKVVPKSDDILQPMETIDVENEINQLQKDMSSIDLHSIPFDKSDFVIVFIAGLIGAACDIILGKPADGYNGILEPAAEPKVNDEFAFGLGKHLKQYDLKNNPIDKTIPGIQVGDHRLFSYGHDLSRVFQTVGVMLTGTGPVGVSGLGGEVILEQSPENWSEHLSKLGIDGSNPDASSIMKILVILFLHLYKDYCSTRSLPIPGSTYIANLNNDTMPNFLDELTNDKELNLHTLNGQLLSVFAIELIISIYSLIRKKSDDKSYSDDQYKNKKEKLLLISHSIALAFNLGKVAVTKNPAFINFPQIIRIIMLVWKVVKAEILINQKAIEKVNMSALKNQLETYQTLIILDDAIYYTKQIDTIIEDMKKDFDRKNAERRENIKSGFDELECLLAQLKAIN